MIEHIEIKVPGGWRYYGRVIDTDNDEVARFKESDADNAKYINIKLPHKIGDKIDCPECGGGGFALNCNIDKCFNDCKYTHLKNKDACTIKCPSCTDGKAEVTAVSVVGCEVCGGEGVVENPRCTCADGTECGGCRYETYIDCPSCKGKTKYRFKIVWGK